MAKYDNLIFIMYLKGNMSFTLELIFIQENDWIQEWLERNNTPTVNYYIDRYNATVLMYQQNLLDTNERPYVEAPNFINLYETPDTNLINEILIQQLGRAGAGGILVDNNDQQLDRIKMIRLLSNLSSNTNPVARAQLLPSQVPHFQRVVNILDKTWYAYQDTTPMGGGKTYIVSALAQYYLQKNPKFKMLVIAPLAVRSKWQSVPPLFGVPVLQVINYEKLAGRRGFKLKHPYLTRQNTGKHSTFAPTPYLDQIIRDGVLVVFDENHLVRNRDTLRGQAALTIVNRIIAFNSARRANSRITLLSASPGNKEEHTFSLIKMLGLTSYNKLYVNNQPTGYNDIYAKAYKYNSGVANQIATHNPVNEAEALAFVHKFYVHIFKPIMSSSAPLPEIPMGRDFKNGFYHILDERNRLDIKIGINMLEELKKRQEPTPTNLSESQVEKLNMIGGVDISDKKGFELLTMGLMRIERGKVNDIARVAHQTLSHSTRAKVIIGVNYRSSIGQLQLLLQRYNPLVLTGEVTKQSKRDEIIGSFQANSGQHRLLLMITTVGSVGIDLDDKYGNWPRTMLLVPDYMFLAKYQATGRIARVDTQSLATLRFFYGKGDFIEEKNLLDSMVKNSKFASDLLSSDVHIPFPGDFEDYEEI